MSSGNFADSNPMKSGSAPARSSDSPVRPPRRPLPQNPSDREADVLGELEEPPKPKKLARPPPRQASNRVDSQSNLTKTKSSRREDRNDYSPVEMEIDVEQGAPGESKADASVSPPAPAEKPRNRDKSGNSANPRELRDAAATSAKQQQGSSDAAKKNSERFKGENPLQYGLWAHYLAIGAAAMCICMGAFSILWSDARTYGCHINGEEISPIYQYLPNGQCPTLYVTPKGHVKEICCDPNSESSLEGYVEIGVFYILYGIVVLFYENTDWGWGLYFPADALLYRWRVSITGLVHMIVGVAGLYNYATCLAGACVLVTGLVYWYAVDRNEAGDGGRAARRIAAEQAREKKARDPTPPPSLGQQASEFCAYVLSFNPVTFCRRIYNEDKLASYVWVGIYLALNFALFVYTLYVWYGIVNTMRDDLLHGTLKVDCADLMCHVNRKAVKFGPVSRFAPWAKACGGCLNLNCALLLLPVVRLLIRKINNLGESFSFQQHSNDLFSRFFAHPLTRYLPLQKNIEFHKLCAWAIFFYAWGHMIFHWINLWVANEVTLRLFRFAGWNGTDYFTGALVTFAMFIIYTAAPDVVRLSKYEVFFRSHHMFTVFYLAMFLHGPVFFYWTCIPVLLYLLERYLQTRRGNRPYVLLKVEYIPPVMALYFRPVFKEDFVFKEGQYLYLNCPWISPSEWHPFTISSASEDMMNTVRIHLETGEEVQEVPRPKTLPANAKWNKYCLATQDYTQMEPHEYLDKSDTGFFDYVSLHIKVHGLEAETARTWTRKLKEFIELMSPGQTPSQKRFPFYFHRRDARGDIQMGRQFAPDGVTQLLRVDGPHSAPAEHYARYGTLMLIGAGIGLTPCVSILTSLTKYRWKKNYQPELLHFYWIVRHNEVASFQWLVHLLANLDWELKKARHSQQIDRRYYLEMHIYVTAFNEADVQTMPQLYRSSQRVSGGGGTGGQVAPSFTADELYALLLRPTTAAKEQIAVMAAPLAQQRNRLQDVWVWNGRPSWDHIFQQMKSQRQHSDIGVCFCGAPAIGADLRSMCEKYSDAKDDCLFSLHKENF